MGGTVVENVRREAEGGDYRLVALAINGCFIGS